MGVITPREEVHAACRRSGCAPTTVSVAMPTGDGQLDLGFESRPSAENVVERLRGVASQEARVCGHRR